MIKKIKDKRLDNKFSNTGLGPDKRPDSQGVWSHGFGLYPINRSCWVTWVGPKPTTRLDSPVIRSQGFNLNPTPSNLHDRHKAHFGPQYGSTREPSENPNTGPAGN